MTLGLPNSFTQWNEDLSSMQVFVDPGVTEGVPQLGVDLVSATCRTVMFAHPVDVIATMHSRDPATRVQRTVAYRLAAAFDKLDAVAADIDRRVAASWKRDWDREMWRVETRVYDDIHRIFHRMGTGV